MRATAPAGYKSDEKGFDVAAMNDYSIYIHLPFCKTRCAYCDFFSIAATPIPFEGYLNAVTREWERRRSAFEPFGPLRSLYIGGGTPSLWPAELLCELLGRFALHAETEVTVEVNPRDADRAWFQAVVRAGVNRFSVGVQSLDDERLRFLGRTHTARDGRIAVETAVSSGARSVSGDLIYGTPGQTAEGLSKELRDLMSCGVSHVSAYELTIAEETPLGRRQQQGDRVKAGEHQLTALYRTVRETLADADFAQYEISNWARERHRSVHNISYWQGGLYCGLGAFAHGFFISEPEQTRTRYGNGNLVDAYIDDVLSSEAPTASHLGKNGFTEQISDLDHARERVMLGLRTADGVAFEEILPWVPPGGGLPARWRAEATRLQAEGWVRIQDGRLLPTAEGLLRADGLAERFF